MQRLSLIPFEKAIFFLLLVFIPTQLGKHFWPSWALVQGFRVDYLSPTLYTTDILIGLLVLIVCVRLVRKQYGVPFSSSSIVFLVFLGVSLLSITQAINQPIGWYHVVKLLEMLFFGGYVAYALSRIVSYGTICVAFAIGTFFESILAIAQFFTAASVGGIWYLFGERTFSTLTPGIANASIGGTLTLRPYGTLPHPNLLAAYLLLSVILLASGFVREKNNHIATVFAGAIIFSAIALLLSLSRITILLFFLLFLFVAVFFVLKPKTQKRSYLFVFLGIVFFLGSLIVTTPVLDRFSSTSLSEEAFILREELAGAAIAMFSTKPFLGVGLGNFLVVLPSVFQTGMLYARLQPVHNMYLLVLSETGIFGLMAFLGILTQTSMRIFTRKDKLFWVKLFLMFSVLILGFFDHYFLTLQQGQLLLAFVIGVCYSLPSRKKYKVKPTGK